MSDNFLPFYIQKDSIFAVPIIHYNMETTIEVRRAFYEIQPDCVAVEFAETMELQILHATSRLPDLSLIVTTDSKNSPTYYLCEPCDAGFEALRCALEHGIAAKCIDLDVENYPDFRQELPDPYAISKIGLKKYYETYEKISLAHPKTTLLDSQRELYMAKRLKELSFSYERILFVGGMEHTRRILGLIDQSSFPEFKQIDREQIQLCTLTEESSREVMAEFGWISKHYEASRNIFSSCDRQKLIYDLFKVASVTYEKTTGNSFLGYEFRNTMKFVRNYALATHRLMPDLYQILSAAKGCVNHNYAYEVWLLATDYPYLQNIDNLPTLNLSIEDIWGHSKIIRFHKTEPSRKRNQFKKRRKDQKAIHLEPPGPFNICSYPPEDLIIENFGRFLQKKATRLLSEESAKTVPFSSSLEDGIDTRETIRHWFEHKLYVKTRGKPAGGVGSVVVIFDEDLPEKNTDFKEKYPWKLSWIGEHDQESDMAFYSTEIHQNVVGPGISRCEYGGFFMSYPPRRVWNIWNDPDYFECRTKSEVLLMAAIDYALKPLIVYVSKTPPRSYMKSFAARYGKKIVYIPSSQLSPVTLNKLRIFHVLDGHSKRKIAEEYIF